MFIFIFITNIFGRISVRYYEFSVYHVFFLNFFTSLYFLHTDECKIFPLFPIRSFVVNYRFYFSIQCVSLNF